MNKRILVSITSRITIFFLGIIAFGLFLSNKASAQSADPLSVLPGYTTSGIYQYPNQRPEDRGWVFLLEDSGGEDCFDLSNFTNPAGQPITRIRYLMFLNNSPSNLTPDTPGADPDGVRVINRPGGTGAGSVHANAITYIKTSDKGDAGVYGCHYYNNYRRTISPTDDTDYGVYGTVNSACALGGDPFESYNEFGAASGYMILDVACSNVDASGRCIGGNASENPNRVIINGPGNDFCMRETGTSESYRLYSLDYNYILNSPTPTPLPTPTNAPIPPRVKANVYIRAQDNSLTPYVVSRISSGVVSAGGGVAWYYINNVQTATLNKATGTSGYFGPGIAFNPIYSIVGVTPIAGSGPINISACSGIGCPEYYVGWTNWTTGTKEANFILQARRSININVRDSVTNAAVPIERICYGASNENYTSFTDHNSTCVNNTSFLALDPLPNISGQQYEWHYGASTLDLPPGYTVVGTTSQTTVTPPGSSPYPLEALVNRNNTQNIWSLLLRDYWGEGHRDLVLYVNTSNSPPTAAASFVQVETCAAASGSTISGRYSGIYNDTLAIHNPMTITTYHEDPDGINDLYDMGFSVFPQGGDPANIGMSTYSVVRRFGPNDYRQMIGTTNNMSLTDPRVGVNILDTNTQVARYRTNIPSDAASYMKALAVTQISPTRLAIDWEVAYLNSIAFNGNVSLQAFSTDQGSNNSGWMNDNTLGWTVDLIRPTVTNPTANQSVPNQIQTTFTAADNIGLHPNGFAKQCSAFNLVGGENITLTKPPSSSLVLNTNNNFVTCISHTTPPYSDTYGYINTTSNGNVNFRFTATDNACNAASNNVSTVNSPDPWILTSSGDVFLSEINNLTYPATIINSNLTENGQQPNFSRFLYTQNNASLPSRASLRNYSRADYDDLNDTPRVPGQSNWYDYLKNKTLESVPASRVHNIPAITFTVPINLASVMQTWLGATIDQNQVYALNVAGSATFSGTLNCNMKLVVIVAGNLTLTPDVTAPGSTQGCIFIVRGTTTINAGSNKGSNDTIPITNYDLVQGFILTNSIITNPDPSLDGLLIEGAVITNILNSSGTNSFNRSLTVLRNQQAPSEIIRYDSRYLYIFGDLFNYEKSYNIRETQFIRSLSD